MITLTVLLIPLVFAAIAIWAFVFWILMLVDVVRRPFAKSEEKIIWFIVVFFLHFLGAVIYYFVVKKKGTA